MGASRHRLLPPITPIKLENFLLAPTVAQKILHGISLGVKVRSAENYKILHVVAHRLSELYRISA
jgi:hypothetical protein